MADTKPEVLISKLAEQLGSRFQRQNLCFRGLALQCDLVQYHHATPEVGMSTSGLVPTILDFPIPVWRDDIVLGPIVTGDPENIGFAVETVILAVLSKIKF
jgi:hypothetical protein